LVRFLDDGHIEMDTKSVKRAMRPIAFNRRNSLFGGHDQGAANCACIASLIDPAKMQDIDPKTYLISSANSLLAGRWRRSTIIALGMGGLQSLVKFGKLRLQDLVKIPLRRPDHDRVATLPMIAVGLMARPLIRHRELQLNRWTLPAEFA
jgi:hypothetical protein